MSTSKYVRVSPDLELYYEEAGTGKPVIFIPGWAGTTEFYAHQMPYFARNYHALTYDPRSQGRSTRTLENNHYLQHGKDLRAFIDALGLRDVALVALSAGCYDIYGYFRAFGPDNVRAAVFIDNPPRGVAARKGDWGGAADWDEARAFMNAIVYDVRGFIPNLVTPMFKRQIRADELDWASEQLLKTPNYAAALTIADYLFSDYTAEAKMIDGKIAVLNILAEDQEEAGKAWLAANAPHSETFVLGKHLMLLEFPDQFNAGVAAFLEKVG
jgi:non-heme chloroperoxidase